MDKPKNGNRTCTQNLSGKEFSQVDRMATRKCETRGLLMTKNTSITTESSSATDKGSTISSVTLCSPWITPLQAMFVPLMTNQLVPPVEPLVTIPITARIEALEGACDREVFLEMAREVGVAAESLIAGMVGTEESGRRAMLKITVMSADWIR